MKIRSYNHAMDLIAATMLPWELDARGWIRLFALRGGTQPLVYCPLCAVAQAVAPDGLCPSGTLPFIALPWAGYTISETLENRIIGAADNVVNDMQPSDRALLLAACGLA